MPPLMKPAAWLFSFTLALSAYGAQALEIVPYQPERFAAARAAGMVTAVQFHSGWCPICVMQSRSLESLKNDRELERVIVFQADFAKEEALRRRLAVHAFSTLVIFRGEEERARTIGDFQPEKLKALFAKAQ
ncbi:MAG: thioredoxin family protein [Rhodocyclaceae bacterium]|nr:thioredoxin family protein [Rhodocyclaceae bacterium]